jgi:hypothetical protein
MRKKHYPLVFLTFVHFLMFLLLPFFHLSVYEFSEPDKTFEAFVEVVQHGRDKGMREGYRALPVAHAQTGGRQHGRQLFVAQQVTVGQTSRNEKQRGLREQKKGKSTTRTRERKVDA